MITAGPVGATVVVEVVAGFVVDVVAGFVVEVLGGFVVVVVGRAIVVAGALVADDCGGRAARFDVPQPVMASTVTTRTATTSWLRPHSLPRRAFRKGSRGTWTSSRTPWAVASGG